MNEVYTRYSLQSHLLIVSECSSIPLLYGGNLNGRKNITGFSASSRCRMRRFLRTSEAEYRTMLTLTYPEGYPTNGKIFKEHLRRFVQELKRHSLGGAKWSCFWFMEFQKRGAAHFHLFITEDYDKRWVAKRWFEIVGSDDKRHLRAGTRIERIFSGRRGVCSYAAKYASKSDQKEIPEWVKNAGRFWGVSGNRNCVSADITIKRKEQRSSVVTMKVNKLKESLKNHISANNVTFLSKGTTGIFFIKSNIVVEEIKVLLKMIEFVGNIDKSVSSLVMPDKETEKEQWV